MMARIEATERLAAINDGAVAAGNLEERAKRRMIARLERTANGGRSQRAARARPDQLAGMGIGVRIESSGASQKAPSEASGVGDG